MAQSTIEQLRLKKVLINDIEVVREHITQIQLFESITQPGITGYLDIMDYQAIVEKGNIFADDKVKIIFTVEGQSDLTLEYILYSNEGGKVIPNQQYNTARFGICSPWLIPALSKTFSKNYKDKFIHEIVQELLLECGASVGFIEPTKQKLEIFVSPLWSPYHTIKHLLSFALNQNGSGGYLCWTDLKTGKVNVTTLDYLMKGTLGRFDEFIVNGTNPRYHGRVSDMTIETNFDLIRLVNNGSANTKYYGFNYDKGKTVVTDVKINQTKQTHLSKKFPIPLPYMNDPKYTSVKFCSHFPNTKGSIAGDDNKLQDLLDGTIQNEYSLLSTDVFKMNIITNGDPDRRVGWLAKVDFPSQNKNVEGHSSELYTQYKGDYLIRDINHTFSFFVEYKQAICLCADGFKEFTRDAIAWS